MTDSIAPEVYPDAYCREHGTPRATCDESHAAQSDPLQGYAPDEIVVGSGGETIADQIDHDHAAKISDHNALCAELTAGDGIPRLTWEQHRAAFAGPVMIALAPGLQVAAWDSATPGTVIALRNGQYDVTFPDLATTLSGPCRYPASQLRPWPPQPHQASGSVATPPPADTMTANTADQITAAVAGGMAMTAERAARDIANALIDIVSSETMAHYCANLTGHQSLAQYEALVRAQLGADYQAGSWDIAMAMLRSNAPRPMTSCSAPDADDLCTITYLAQEHV